MPVSSVTRAQAGTVHRPGTATLLYGRAQQMGLQPVWVIPDGMFAVSVGGREKYINFACSPLNSHASASVARDKYLTRLILKRNNIRNIPFMRPQTQPEAASFLQVYGKIIAKPVGGSGSNDIHIITHAAELEALNISKYILEQYIAGREMRYLVLDGAVIGVHHSDYGTSVQADRLLKRISYPRTEWDEALVAESIKVARVLDLQFAAVDFMIDESGTAYILEVNTAPGLKWFHTPTTGPKVDVAKLFLEAAFGGTVPGKPEAHSV